MHSLHSLHPFAAGRHRGFTLIELLVVIAIAAILAGVGVPSLKGMLKSVQLTSATNDLFASLMIARSEAAVHNERVVLCKSADGVSCASTGGWEQGLIVFRDPNNNGQRDPGEPLVHSTQALPSELRIEGNQNVARYVSYAPGGVAKLVSGAFQAGTITLCNSSQHPGAARQIVISSAGRPRIQKTTVATCS